MTADDLKKYFHTVKYLKPSQLFWQAFVLSKIPYRLAYEQTQKQLRYHSFPAVQKHLSYVIPFLDTPEVYLSRFDPDRIVQGSFCFLHQQQVVPNDVWKIPTQSHLWNFHLHYFEYGVALAFQYAKTKNLQYSERLSELIDSWIKQPMSGDGWHPYTISVRLSNWLICLDVAGDGLPESIREKMYKSIYLQYCFLRNCPEKHLLGNHYFENLKALILCAALFGDQKRLSKYVFQLRQQLAEQILPDGMHMERSFMYHKIVLEDLIRIVYLLKQMHIGCDPYLAALNQMADALYFAEQGLARTPLFNDSANNEAKPAVVLWQTMSLLFDWKPKYSCCLDCAGYYKLQTDRFCLLIDCGSLGPSYLPGHSHCDTLSFEMYVAGIPVFVNAGTGLYQGSLRSYFRSTSAHNTVVIDEKEQAECWAEHRVARRTSKVRATCTDTFFSGRYTTYFGAEHHRRIQLESTGFEVCDSIREKHLISAKSYLHLADGFEVKQQSDTQLLIWGKGLMLTVTAQNCCAEVFSKGNLCLYAPEFGSIKKSTTLCFDAKQPCFGYRVTVHRRNEK